MPATKIPPWYAITLMAVMTQLLVVDQDLHLLVIVKGDVDVSRVA